MIKLAASTWGHFSDLVRILLTACCSVAHLPHTASATCHILQSCPSTLNKSVGGQCLSMLRNSTWETTYGQRKACRHVRLAPPEVSPRMVGAKSLLLNIFHFYSLKLQGGQVRQTRDCKPKALSSTNAANCAILITPTVDIFLLNCLLAFILHDIGAWAEVIRRDVPQAQLLQTPQPSDTISVLLISIAPYV